MARWQKQDLKLRDNHGWKTKPGYSIFVADRGAVRFDVPQGWIVAPNDGPLKICDKEPPDDNCCIQLTIFRLPPGIDWSALPLPGMLEDATNQHDDDDDKSTVLARGDVVHIVRTDLEIAWRETRFLDKEQNREAISRNAIARGSNIQPLITFDFWVDDAPRLYPIWDE